MPFEVSTASTIAALARREVERSQGRHSKVADLYLDLLENTLTGIILDDPSMLPSLSPTAGEHNRAMRVLGTDWPFRAATMIGLPRLRNLRRCISTVLEDDIEGDFIETGVWRGGACIFMRANLAVYGDTTRKVWVADSFEGLPPPDPENFPIDQHDELHKVKELAVSLEEVKANFLKYNMLDDQVVFLKGFFKDSLPNAPIGKLSIVRLDGDMYESTIQALETLYPKLSAGGFLIVDDYCLPNCAAAVTDYRDRYKISEPIQNIDDSGVYWRKV